MSNRLAQNLLFLLLLSTQVLILGLEKRVSGLSLLREPTGATLLMAANLLAGSYLFPSNWRFGRRLIRFSALQCFLLFLLILLFGWHPENTLQDVTNSLLLYVFALLPIIVAQSYKD